MEEKTGIIIKSTGSWHIVRDDQGNDYHCRIKGKFRVQGIRSTNPVAVGDKVDFKVSGTKEGIIFDIHDRKNYIIRKSINLSRKGHIIAANVDQAFLMVTLAKPKTYPAFIDRFLASAEAYRIPARLVFNKIDIYQEEENLMLKEYQSIYEKIGYPCYTISATQGINLESLKKDMTGKSM